MGMLMGVGQAQDRAQGRAGAGHAPRTDSRAGSREYGWVWWPENDDLVLGLTGGADADAIIAALDGKTPSRAAEHAISEELAKPEGASCRS